MEIEKTPVMRNLEARFCQDDQTIYDLLKKEYCDEKNGAEVLGKRWGVDPRSVLRGVRHCGLPVHPSVGSPGFYKVEEFSKRHKDALKTRWEDEDKKKERVAKIHNKTWHEAVKGSWGNLSPGEKALRVSKTIDGRKKTREAKIVACLGEDPKQVLKTWVEEGLSALEIASNTRLSRFKIERCLQEAGLKPHKKTTLNREAIKRKCGLVQLASEADLMQYLLPNDRLVLKIRFGSNGQVVPLEEIRKQLNLNLTKQRIAQIEARALSVLEKMLLGELIPINGVVSFKRGRRSTPLAGKPFSD